MTDAVVIGPAQRRPKERPVATNPTLLQHVGKPCPYCGQLMRDRGHHMVSRDHILSRMNMAKMVQCERLNLHRFNRIIVGDACNRLKGSMTLYDFAKMYPAGSVRAKMLAVLIESLRAKHPPDVFAALTGLPVSSPVTRGG